MSDAGGGLFAPENAGMLWVLTFGVGFLIFALWIFVQWRIFAKAGFPGPLALINLAVFVPFVGFLVVFGLQVWFAFAEWPALKRNNTA